MMKRIGELKVEVANLKAKADQSESENARLEALTAEMDKTINASQAECRRLKAEVERLTAFTTRTIIPNEELQAQVERLTADLQMEKENEDRLVREWQKANNEVYGLKTQVAALIDELERLRKGVQS
jgi:chromosome segregation ATPase